MNNTLNVPTEKSSNLFPNAYKTALWNTKTFVWVLSKHFTDHAFLSLIS